jgi:hypothetical protein
MVLAFKNSEIPIRVRQLRALGWLMADRRKLETGRSTTGRPETGRPETED